MTYRSLKTFIKNNTQEHNTKIFDLIPFSVKSKIIFVIGKDANNTASYLTAIMKACEIEYTRLINDKIDINKKILQNGMRIPMDMLCENAEKIIKSTNKMISNDDLFLCLALSFSDNDYSIIEIREEYYLKIKDIISHLAIILTTDNQSLVENAPKEIKEVIALSKEDNFDYISNTYNQNGARITLASPNKIIISNGNLLGTCFYHYNYLYHVSTLNLNNVPLAHLSVEAATVLFYAPRPYIYKGLDNAILHRDVELYSLSPPVLLYEGENDFKLHHRLKFKKVTVDDEFVFSIDNTIFCGNKEYIEAIKGKLKKR